MYKINKLYRFFTFHSLSPVKAAVFHAVVVAAGTSPASASTCREGQPTGRPADVGTQGRPTGACVLIQLS